MRNKVHEVRQKILRHIVDRGTPERQYLPSIRTFEQTTGCSRQTVHLALRELVDAEVLTAVPRGGRRARARFRRFRTRISGLAAGSV